MGARITTPTVFAIAVASAALVALRLKNGGFRRTAEGLEKRCAKCREYWPADNTAFYPAVAEPDGLSRWCKACYVEWRAKWEARRSAQAQGVPV